MAAEEAPRPDHRDGLSSLRRKACWVVAIVALLAYSLQWFGVPFLSADTYGQTVIAQGLAMGIIFLSFVVVTGLGGMVSLAQAHVRDRRRLRRRVGPHPATGASTCPASRRTGGSTSSPPS